MRIILAFGLLAATPALAAELPVTGSYRDTASCEAVQALAGDDASDDDDATEGGSDEGLSSDERDTLSDAIESGVTLDASTVSGPGGWVCTFPEVWTVRDDRWMAMAACEAGNDFFPAVLTLERLEETRYRLRLGDGADAADLIPCEIATPEAPSDP